jgi:hypothetical protein
LFLPPYTSSAYMRTQKEKEIRRDFVMGRMFSLLLPSLFITKAA